jgi:hypothetical protein
VCDLMCMIASSRQQEQIEDSEHSGPKTLMPRAANVFFMFKPGVSYETPVGEHSRIMAVATSISHGIPSPNARSAQIAIFSAPSPR